jgi:hypothetical protein
MLSHLFILNPNLVCSLRREIFGLLGQISSTASSASKRMRARFSTEPPYASTRRFGELTNPAFQWYQDRLRHMTSRWQPFSEPLHRTLMRNGTIAIVLGAVVARFWGGLSRWPLAALLALWPSLGGHLLEVWFLNWLRPRLSTARPVQIAARVVVWFVGGIGLALGMGLTAIVLTRSRPVHLPAWWMAGLAFICLELAVHLILQLRGEPSFYNGCG